MGSFFNFRARFMGHYVFWRRFLLYIKKEKNYN